VRHQKGIRRSAAAGAVATLLTACPPIEYPEQFGLSPTSQGVPAIRIAGCPPYAWDVRLTLAADPKRVLWRLAPGKNRSTVLPGTFLIGSVPEGFKEHVSLRRGLAPSVEYRITLASGEAYIVSLDFSLEDLRQGYVLDFDEHLVPNSRFPLRTSCSTPTRGATGG
jgi:hypothetical protein